MLNRRKLDWSPRLEMTPLMDVIFLLLTFFMVAMVLLRHVKTRQIEMAQIIETRLSADQGGDNVTIRHFLIMDSHGGIWLNDQEILEEELSRELALCAAEEGAVLHVGLEKQGEKDRAPLFFSLMQRVDEAGFTHVTFTELTSP